MDEQQNLTICEVDFDNIGNMAFSVPVSFRFYRKQRKSVSSWKECYLQTMKEFAKMLPNEFQTDAHSSSLPQNELGDLKESRSMRDAAMLRRGVYIETDLGAATMLRRIRDILSCCNLPYTNLSISYVVEEERKQRYQEARAKAEQQPKTFFLDWDMIISYNEMLPVSCRYKNQRTRRFTTWADIYAFLLSELAKEYPRKIKSGLSANGRRSPDILSASKKKSFRKPRSIGNDLFIETAGNATALVDRMYSLINMCGVDQSQIIIGFEFADKDRETEYAQSISGKKALPTDLKADVTNIKRYRTILRKHFASGYRLCSAIDFERFKEHYRKHYNASLEMDQETFKKVMEALFPILNGCAHASMSQEQLCLLTDVTSLIEETFQDGATCIYLEMLYDRYRDDFINHFNLYSAEQIGELITSQPRQRYRIKWNYLCFGRRTPAPDEEVISKISKSRMPVHIDELTKTLWYIPQEKISSIVMSVDSLVVNRQGWYYYAPNLPIGREAKSKIKQALKESVMLGITLTDIGVLSIVLRETPTLLTDVDFLTWKGLWNSLCYLFADVMIADSGCIKLK